MNTFTFSEFGLPKRKPPRPETLRQDNYLDLFDDNTLFYDVFYKNGKLFFFSPPIPESTWEKIVSNVTVNNNPLQILDFNIYKSNKTHKLILMLESVTSVTIFGKDIESLFVDISKIENCKKVLYTVQKNNNILWIKDWINWHIKHHQIDAVIIYDNDSDDYTRGELEAEISQMECKSTVVNVPFIYGPGAYSGSSWDSDYFQYFAFEHARYFYCDEDALFLNMDIDELAVTVSGSSIFDELKESESIVFLHGKWVEIENNEEYENISHESHTLIETNSRCPNKWVSNLTNIPDSVFLRVHDASGELRGIRNTVNSNYLHFRSISTNWKWNRTRKVIFHPSKHERIDLGKYPYIYVQRSI